MVWRRNPVTGVLVREEERFRPWLLLDQVDGLPPSIEVRELQPPGELRYLVLADDFRTLSNAVVRARRIRSLRDLGPRHVLALPPEEQYLVATGRTYFRELTFDQLNRLQFDLETTGLNPEFCRIFMVAIRYQSGRTEVLEARDFTDVATSQCAAGSLTFPKFLATTTHHRSASQSHKKFRADRTAGPTLCPAPPPRPCRGEMEWATEDIGFRSYLAEHIGR